ncbi:MAG: lipopolysaccharide transport system ATP-binding protein [Blastocatellia bacterium]|jgi:lipopolysaccharide transport system ATP-binding protein|nr:lipopolysaccharide transport system ATP-binding protein [Blastocatellia bacterium]
MSDVAITAESIAKEYRIGGLQDSYRTLRDVLAGAALGPVRAFQSLLRRGRVVPDNEIIWALKDISFEVKRGEIVGLIGRNGAGKSTLLKVLSRITEPTRGRARINGRVGSLLEVGTGFHPELSGRENTFLNGAILGMKKSEIKRKFDEIVAFAEVERFVDTPVKHYSSGMYLRLAFAVAAHLEPEILLVDEVLAVGDAAFQNKCLGKMSDIAGEGRTVLFVSHNMPAIKNLCHRALLLDGGSIEREGDAAAVVQYYLQGDYQGSKKVWPQGERPGNESYKLNSVRILNQAGEEVSSVQLSESLVVEIDYEVVQTGAYVSFSLVLFDADGLGLFASLSNTEKDFYGRPLPCGRYKSRCTLSGDLLNTGKFSFSLIGFSANWTDHFRVDQVVSFEATDDGVLRGDYYGPFGGPLRPRFPWETVAY